MLLERLQSVENRVQKACERSGRSRESVKLLLASKKVSAERLKELVHLPSVLLGENTAQELVSKYEQLPSHPFRWHFIGHLQTNKVKDVVGRCELIHSVDRLSLAQEISKRSSQKNQQSSILIEVNTSGESNKSGVSPDQAIALCQQIADLPHLTIQGLMTVPANSEEESVVRAQFRLLKNLAAQIAHKQLRNVEMKELSMGMSQDFEWAIEEGSTIVRVGSLIFGERA